MPLESASSRLGWRLGGGCIERRGTHGSVTAEKGICAEELLPKGKAR